MNAFLFFKKRRNLKLKRVFKNIFFHEEHVYLFQKNILHFVYYYYYYYYYFLQK